MLARDHLADNGNGISDPPPVRELFRPGPVYDSERAAMADGKHMRVFRYPTRTRGMRNQPRPSLQPEDPAHRSPSGATHPDDHRRAQQANKRTQVALGASIDPARENGSGHRPLMQRIEFVRNTGASTSHWDGCFASIPAAVSS